LVAGGAWFEHFALVYTDVLRRFEEGSAVLYFLGRDHVVAGQSRLQSLPSSSGRRGHACSSVLFDCSIIVFGGVLTGHIGALTLSFGLVALVDQLFFFLLRILPLFRKLLVAGRGELLFGILADFLIGPHILQSRLFILLRVEGFLGYFGVTSM
jgi:hypothetical protein